MRRVVVLTLGVASLVACSAGGGRTGGVGDDEVGGRSGTGTGGALPLGGTSGSNNGGTGAIIQGGSNNNGGTGNVCDELTVSSRPVTPTVMMLVDNSSSMYPPDSVGLWDGLYQALMNPTTGAVKPLESKIRFGFASFRGKDGVAVPETDNSCAEIETVGTVTQATVAPALDNHAAIDAVYTAIGTQGRNPDNAQWETPTGHAINRIAATLANFEADPPGPKFILLVTDGNPNTCLVGDPQCGSDVSIKAVQDAYAAGIGTIALGVGAIVNSNAGCEPTDAYRCGALHLQDIANAGTGQPVEPPPMNYWYQNCATAQSGTHPGTPLSTYAAPGGGGMSPYYEASDPGLIRAQLQALLAGVISCTLDMDAIVTGDYMRGTVTIKPESGGERPVTPNDQADGWVLEPNKFQVTLTGQACADYKAGNADVHISFPCGVAEPR
jgi:hypothetical protein